MEKYIRWDFPIDFKGNINELNVDVIAVKSIRPLADFEFKIMTTGTPYEVKFENKSKNADFYSWNFGDLNRRKVICQLWKALFINISQEVNIMLNC